MNPDGNHPKASYPRICGITGRIGSGKTTVAEIFAKSGFWIYNMDKAVHELYAKGGAAVKPIAKWLPKACVDGMIDRKILSQAIRENPEKLKDLEAITHPLLEKNYQIFLSRAAKAQIAWVIVEIPLLFESDKTWHTDATILVTASEKAQNRRVLARPDMDPDKLKILLARQMPDSEKRAKVDFLIDSDCDISFLEAKVQAIIENLRDPDWHSQRLT